MALIGYIADIHSMITSNFLSKTGEELVLRTLSCRSGLVLAIKPGKQYSLPLVFHS